MTETWKPVKGMEAAFEVSDQGRVRTIERIVRFVDKLGREQFRLKASRTVATQMINSGYLSVHLSLNRVRQARTLHSVVAEAFIGPRPKGMDVCHNNGNRLDNRAANLRYDTRTANHHDRIAHGTVYDGATAAKLTLENIRSIRARYDGTPGFARSIAPEFGVTPRTIRRVIRMRSWKYVS